eukprot:m.4762 g.4762  ORF g.4762 m.4762 type:complete len:500 (+) comp3976_c0_seq1:93-1592(+)
MSRNKVAAHQWDQNYSTTDETSLNDVPPPLPTTRRPTASEPSSHRMLSFLPNNTHGEEEDGEMYEAVESQHHHQERNIAQSSKNVTQTRNMAAQNRSLRKQNPYVMNPSFEQDSDDYEKMKHSNAPVNINMAPNSASSSDNGSNRVWMIATVVLMVCVLIGVLGLVVGVLAKGTPSTTTNNDDDDSSPAASSQGGTTNLSSSSVTELISRISLVLSEQTVKIESLQSTVANLQNTITAQQTTIIAHQTKILDLETEIQTLKSNSNNNNNYNPTSPPNNNNSTDSSSSPYNSNIHANIEVVDGSLLLTAPNGVYLSSNTTHEFTEGSTAWSPSKKVVMAGDWLHFKWSSDEAVQEVESDGVTAVAGGYLSGPRTLGGSSMTRVTEKGIRYFRLTSKGHVLEVTVTGSGVTQDGSNIASVFFKSEVIESPKLTGIGNFYYEGSSTFKCKYMPGAMKSTSYSTSYSSSSSHNGCSCPEDHYEMHWEQNSDSSEFDGYKVCYV